MCNCSPYNNAPGVFQATPENVRELKYALDSGTPEPSNEANFTAALTVAFEILHRVSSSSHFTNNNALLFLPFFPYLIDFLLFSITEPVKVVSATKQLC